MYLAKIRKSLALVFWSYSGASYSGAGISPAGLHAGFLPRLWGQLWFCCRRGDPVVGHIRVHEGGVPPLSSEDRPAASPSPQSRLQTQRDSVRFRLGSIRCICFCVQTAAQHFLTSVGSFYLIAHFFFWILDHKEAFLKAQLVSEVLQDAESFIKVSLFP